MKKLFVAIAILFLVLSLTYTVLYYKRINLLPMIVKVNNIDIGNTSKEDALKILNKEIASDIIINDEYLNKPILTLTHDNIGLTINYTPLFEELFDANSGFLWWNDYLVQYDLTYSTKLLYDENMLKDYIDLFSDNWNNYATPSKDAYINFGSGKFEIVDEIHSTKINSSKLLKAIQDVIQSPSLRTINISQCFVPTLVKDTREKLSPRVDLLNTYKDFYIDYESGEHIDFTMMVNNNWFFEENGILVFDEDIIFDYVKSLEGLYDTIGKTRVFTTVNNKEILIRGGNYGFEIDSKKEFTRIMGDIKTNKPVTRSLTLKATGNKLPVISNNALIDYDVHARYIEVSLTDQCMWVIEKGQIIFTSDLVTGLPPKRTTPSGTFKILEKARDKILRGADYATPVTYWMRVTWQGHGFHDATWQAKFGGTRYLKYGSHGCLNMPFNKAKELYSIINVNDPVFIY